jgi:hypothetical protein
VKFSAANKTLAHQGASTGNELNVNLMRNWLEDEFWAGAGFEEIMAMAVKFSPASKPLAHHGASSCDELNVK